MIMYINIFRYRLYYILKHFSAGEDISNRHCKNSQQLLWKAPEFLREIKFDNFMTMPSLASPTSISNSNYRQILVTGSQKGDVYSFAIILYEIMGRQGPWGRGYMTSSEASCKKFLSMTDRVHTRP